MIYLDHSATTKPYPEVLHTYMEVAQNIWGNPSSLHRMGSQAKRILEASRRQIADLLGKEADEIIFTSGGTEADNWAIKGVAFAKQDFGKHLIVSAIEHPAVKASAQWLSQQGFSVDYAPVDRQGFVILDQLASLIRPDTILVSIMALNNEVGTIQPIPEIAALLADHPTITFHVDAVQAVGKIPLQHYLCQRVDLASFSAHKYHGPRGVGFLYKKRGKVLEPLLTGGGQESGQRSTTENLAGIAATAKALRLCMERSSQAIDRMVQMTKLIRKELETYPDLMVFSADQDQAPHILTFGIKGIRGEVLVHAFEEHEIFLSTTSACSSKAGQAAGTLIAMGIPAKDAQTAVRLSLGEETDMSHVEQFLTIFKLIYAQTQKVR